MFTLICITPFADETEIILDPVDKLKPFKCSICPSTFTLKGNLTKHVQNIHDKKKQFDVSSTNVSEELSDCEGEFFSFCLIFKKDLHILVWKGWITPENYLQLEIIHWDTMHINAWLQALSVVLRTGTVVTVREQSPIHVVNWHFSRHSDIY